MLDPDLDLPSLGIFEASASPQSQLAAPPRELYVLPLLRKPFFPGMAAPLVVEPGPYYDAIKNVNKTPHKCLGLMLTKDENCDVYKTTLSDFYKVGVLARILKIIPLEQGGAQVILNIEKRMKVKERVKGNKLLKVHATTHDDHEEITPEIKAYAINIIAIIKELLKLNPLFKEELQIFLGHSDFADPGKLADFATALTTSTREEQQKVLETYNVQKRIDKALVLLKKELDVTKLKTHISQQVDAAVSHNQREFILREQLKSIKRELGLDKDDKVIDKEKFEARLKEREVPPDVMEAIDEEMDKLMVLDPQSAEYAVARGYLDWLTIIPWGIQSEENHNLRKAKQILSTAHYGLEDIKQRILEFISVGKLSGAVRGSILCLVGPPGVGKTSIGKSIANALNRKFYRFSVGGMRDEAEIKGHRRTYIGAMPGKLIQALKSSQTMNPIIMLDEVDKMGSSYQGDPGSALLEVLDPEQNGDFLDHFLDVRCDLSNVLFIVTANVLDTIPDPLKDRMDILRLSGYIMEEKIEIANKFLIPRNRKQMGIKANQVSFTKSALKQIINGYARESGVRSLENYIKKILRKVALEIVTEMGKKSYQDKHHKISHENVKKYLGSPIFTSDRFYHHNPVGVCTGLAWTAMGGATLYIEAIRTNSDKTSMKLTGQAGHVMKESSEIAWSYLNSAVHKYAPGHPFFEKSEVHMHIPEGATPKDGPSAGITMVTSLISLLIGVPIKQDLGMTGELTLTGRVLEIGGVKEKVVAAKRSGLKELIFPKENLSDFEELPAFIKKNIAVHFVEHYDEVFPIAFPHQQMAFVEEEYE